MGIPSALNHLQLINYPWNSEATFVFGFNLNSSANLQQPIPQDAGQEHQMNFTLGCFIGMDGRRFEIHAPLDTPEKLFNIVPAAVILQDCAAVFFL